MRVSFFDPASHQAAQVDSLRNACPWMRGFTLAAVSLSTVNRNPIWGFCP